MIEQVLQGDKMSVYEYREKMKSLIDIYAAMGGEWVPRKHKSPNS